MSSPHVALPLSRSGTTTLPRPASSVDPSRRQLSLASGRPLRRVLEPSPPRWGWILRAIPLWPCRLLRLTIPRPHSGSSTIVLVPIDTSSPRRVGGRTSRAFLCRDLAPSTAWQLTSTSSRASTRVARRSACPRPATVSIYSSSQISTERRSRGSRPTAIVPARSSRRRRTAIRSCSPRRDSSKARPRRDISPWPRWPWLDCWLAATPERRIGLEGLSLSLGFAG